MRILVSACLLGIPCRYDGAARTFERILALRERHELIPVCPEQLGGLPTPRAPSEIHNGRVVTRAGEDNTEAFLRGAGCALSIFQTLSCDLAILRAKSPSCGLCEIYDGTFSRTLTSGDGLTASALKNANARVLRDDDPQIASL